MNKTMSKARELLMNSRLMKKNEAQESKIENQANPIGEERSVDNNRIELGDSKSENKSSENIIDNSNNSNHANIVSSGNLVTHSQENINKTKNTDKCEFKITTEKDTDNENLILSDVNPKKEEIDGLKLKLSDRLALFENRKNSKESEKQSNAINTNNKDKPDKIDKIDIRPEQKKLNVNKPNLLDRFNKNVNKGPVIIKQCTLPVKEENTQREESNNPHSEMKLTSVDQDKLMKRMISAKVNKGPINGKDLGKSKASERIVGLASMLQNKLGPKEKNESLEQKTFLLTNDADTQIFNDDNKAIESKYANDEHQRPIEQQESIVILERKSHIDMMLDKPMYNTKTAKKRTQKTFQLKDEI